MNNKTHTNPNLITKLSKNLNLYRKDNIFCDFTIKSNDNKTLSVHKNVLRSASTFFEKVFDSGMREAREDTMVLDKISGENLEKIVEYMYTGNIEVTFENATEIFDAALFLGFDDLVEFSTKVLIDGIDKESICSLLQFGKTMLTDDLTNACYKWIFDNIELVSELKDIENFRFDNIKEIMKRKNDFNLCEDKIHTMIMKWIKFDDKTRKCHAKELFECLRFNFMSKEYLISEEVLETVDFLDDKNFLTKIMIILREHDERKYKRIKLSSSSSVGCSTSALNENTLYVVTEKYIHTFDPEMNILTKYCALTYECSNFFCIGIGNGSFFYGDGKYCELFSKEKDKWVRLPVSCIRHLQGVCFKNKILFRSKVFDLINCSWIDIANSIPCSTDYVCTLNNHIYMYGCCYSKYKYKLYRSEDPVSSWECLTTTISKSNCYLSIKNIIGFDNYIYCFTNYGYCVFDLKEKRWFNDFVAYEEDLKNEREGIVKTFFQQANDCKHDKLKNEWLIEMKSYPGNMEFQNVILHKNEFYFLNGNIVDVYKAPYLDFSRQLEIPYSENEDKSVKYLISN